MSASSPLLLLGEVYVDFTLPSAGAESKVRLGGVVHAARGLWALGADYAVAAVCPRYMVDSVRTYLRCVGCGEFIWLAEVYGAPNVMAVGDAIEVGMQGYESILNEHKSVEFRSDVEHVKRFESCLVFPGSFDLAALRPLLADTLRASFDIAYDLPSLEPLAPFREGLTAIITSTSSAMFHKRAADDTRGLLSDLRDLSPQAILLKENRGGSRVYDLHQGEEDEVPALLSETINSVGVGDVYSAAFVQMLGEGVIDAAWKAARVATCYAHTTFPDDFSRDVKRSLVLTVGQMRSLGGTFLPWHARREFQVYFAAPDFAGADRWYIDEVLGALEYHNFRVRRPVQEVGELGARSSMSEMRAAFLGDLRLLDECDIVFALPLSGDPGTLVEVGLAIARGMPVITFDPLSESCNTMVMAGSTVYSERLDTCLNGLFEAMSKLRSKRR